MKKTKKAAIGLAMLLASSALIFTGCPGETPDLTPDQNQEQTNGDKTEETDKKEDSSEDKKENTDDKKEDTKEDASDEDEETSDEDEEDDGETSDEDTAEDEENEDESSDEDEEDDDESDEDEDEDGTIDISGYEAIVFTDSQVWWNANKYDIDISTLTVEAGSGSSGCFTLNENIATGDKLVVNYTATKDFKLKPVAPDLELEVKADENQYVYEYEAKGKLTQFGIVSTADDTTITLNKVVIIKAETNELLADLVESATNEMNAAVVGTAVGQYSQEAVDALAAKIATAKAIKEASHTRAEYDEATAELEVAVKAFNDAVNKEEGELIPSASDFTKEGWVIITAEKEIAAGSIVTNIGEVAGGDTWSNQIKAPEITLPAGTYTVKAKVNATVARKIQILVQEQNGGWTVAFSKDVALAVGDNEIEETFTTTNEIPNVAVGLMLGYIGGETAPASKLTISGLSLKEVK